MKKQILFIQVSVTPDPTAGDFLLVALDTEGRVWYKKLYAHDEWTLEPVPTETVN